MVQFAQKVRQLSHVIQQTLSECFPIFSLKKVPVKIAECTTDQDCPSRQACLQEKCKNPCEAISPCADRAKCTVHNTLPLRTMSCTCLPGYTGKGDERCEKIGESYHLSPQ